MTDDRGLTAVRRGDLRMGDALRDGDDPRISRLGSVPGLQIGACRRRQGDSGTGADSHRALGFKRGLQEDRVSRVGPRTAMDAGALDIGDKLREDPATSLAVGAKLLWLISDCEDLYGTLLPLKTESLCIVDHAVAPQRLPDTVSGARPRLARHCGAIVGEEWVTDSAGR